MRSTNIAGASEQSTPSHLVARRGLLGVVRGFLVLLALAATGCLPASSDPELEEEQESEEEQEPVGEKELGAGSVDPVRLPIEVLGAEGLTRTVKVTVDDPTNVKHLYVRCNACGYHDSDLDGDPSWVKATVSINGGAPIPIKRYTAGGGDVGNKGIEIIGPERDYGGIGGLFRTVRMKIPISGIKQGTNTIRFNHNQAAAPSIGYRILEMNLLRNGSTKVLSSGSFVQDDPATWTPLLPGAADIAAGKALWSKRNRLVDPGVDAVNGSKGPAIVASCADCHASDGRDLKYFNFSNRSIVQRSIFHGLTQLQGEQIASYIRTRPYADVPAARPWNPTYQPGPNMDKRPAYEWAAGAGVNAILADDADMKGYLFPDDGSISLNDVRAVVSRFGKLDLRELPVSLPMPEWNQWLPLIHPDDAFNTNAGAIKQDKDDKDIGQPYYTALYKAAKSDPTPENIGRMTQFIKPWLQRGMTCDTNGSGNGEPWRGLNGKVLNAIKLPKKTYTSCQPKEDRKRAEEQAYEVAKRGLSAWISVKQWEIVHGNDLEDEGKKEQTAKVKYTGGDKTLNSKKVCSTQCVDARERGWFVPGRNVFDRPPHFVGHNSRHFFGQDRMVGVGETNSWYHLNMILNPGYRIMMPNHFAYVCSHIELLQDESDVDQGFRFWASMIKQRQLQTNGLYGVETGLDLRTAQPHVYYKANRNGNSDTQKSVGPTLWKYFAQAMVEDLVEDAAQATAAEWSAASGNSEVQSSSSSSEKFGDGPKFDVGPWQGRNTRRVIPKLLEIGVQKSAVEDLNDWAKKMWPKGPWNDLL